MILLRPMKMLVHLLLLITLHLSIGLLWLKKNNSTGLVFPISPKYLIFITKGNEGINVVDHRFANTDTIKKFNRMIYEHKTELIVSMSNNLNDVI